MAIVENGRRPQPLQATGLREKLSLLQRDQPIDKLRSGCAHARCRTQRRREGFVDTDHLVAVDRAVAARRVQDHLVVVGKPAFDGAAHPDGLQLVLDDEISEGLPALPGDDLAKQQVFGRDRGGQACLRTSRMNLTSIQFAVSVRFAAMHTTAMRLCPSWLNRCDETTIACEQRCDASAWCVHPSYEHAIPHQGMRLSIAIGR